MVDDFCAERNEDGSGIVKFIPYEEMDEHLMNGDIVVFTETADIGNIITQKNPDMLKQRGWHAEIAFKDAKGGFREIAPWHNSLIQHTCKKMHAHPQSCARNAILGIYRVHTGCDQTIENALKAQVNRWIRIFGHHQFPTPSDHFGIHQYLDPADFLNVADLQNIACLLIRREYDKIAKVTCVQWAYQVLCLALNVPLTRATLSELGVYDEYVDHWKSQLGLDDDSIKPLGKLPFVPYSPAETLQAWLNTYAEGIDLLQLLQTSSAFSGLLEKGLTSLVSNENAADVVLSYFKEVGQKQDLTLPLVIDGRPPYSHVMPIQPFCEVRKPSRPENLRWSYVATAVNRSELVEQ